MIDEEFDSELEEESDPIPRLFTVTHGDISLLQLREGAIVKPPRKGPRWIRPSCSRGPYRA